MKEKKKRGTGEGQDIDPLTVPWAEDHRCHAGTLAPLIDQKENFSPSALGESPGANRHPL